MARLRLSTDAAQLAWPLTGRFTIGRDEENSLTLEADSAVSREHVLIERSGDAYLLRDRGSANGTFIERQSRKWRVAGEVLLEDGDVIEVGRTRLTFEDEMPEPKLEDRSAAQTQIGRILPVPEDTTENRPV